VPARFEASYRQQYQDEEFRQTYITGRDHVYDSVTRILGRLGVSQVFDIGCSFGVLVERLNAAGLDAYGVDLPLPELEQYHARLQHSAGKFYYGDATKIRLPVRRQNSAILVLDSLRYFDGLGILEEHGAQYLIIKENGSHSRTAHHRRPEDQVRFYSPADLLMALPAYEAHEIHATRYVFRISKPGPIVLKCFDHLPSYTFVLLRRDT
jgi:hypothetical protein